MSALDAIVVNTVPPVIRADYRVPVDVIQWVSTSYLLIMGRWKSLQPLTVPRQFPYDATILD